MGELKDDSGRKKPQLTLEDTKLLPSLGGKVWTDVDSGKSLTDDQQRFIKRAKLDIKIILRESHQSSKYELFRRLNTGGSFLSDQELRSCFLVGVNRDFFKWISELAKWPPFQACLPLTENQKEEQYDVELVVRFIVFRTMSEKGLVAIDELGEFITDKAIELAQDNSFDKGEEEKAFKTVFGLLADGLESDSFRKYDADRNSFVGAFLISAFEVIALGLGFNHSRLAEKDKSRIITSIKKKVWSKPDFLTSSGVRATQRLPKTLTFGRSVFST
jgi:hypothetical protein